MTNNISLIIITRNRSEMLTRCLSSIVNQTRMPDEVIVVDNASDDATKKVSLSFKDELPIKYIYEKRIGIPYARNRGVAESRGTLLLMLDDDCEADKFWVERMALSHKKYPKAWAIQGRTFSLPLTKAYSLLAEYDRSIHFRNCAKKTLPLRSFFSKGFRNEVELLTCNTQNFSIKTSYLKKHKLSFDGNFYRGSDADFGRQIIQKNGLIIYCPSIRVAHWERSTLKEFLEQRWHIGRTTARIGDKWKTSSFVTNMPPRLKGLFYLCLFCKIFNQWYKAPILMVLLFLDRLYRLSGWFYEKRLLSLEKQ